MKLPFIVLFLAVVSSGMMSGIFFTWTNAVTPGIGQLDNIGYLKALQAMNRVILNPTFYAAFICPIAMIPLATLLHYQSAPSLPFKLLLVSSIIYLFGAFIVTIAGNIPLNELLDKSELNKLNVKEIEHLRSTIEVKWNNFNLVRTICSTLSFLLLVVSCFILKK